MMWWSLLFSFLRVALVVCLLIPLIFLTDEGQQEFGLTTINSAPLVVFTPRGSPTLSAQERTALFRYLKDEYNLTDFRVSARGSYALADHNFLHVPPSGLIVILTDEAWYGPLGEDFLSHLEKTLPYQEQRVIFIPRLRLAERRADPFLVPQKISITPHIYSGEPVVFALSISGYTSPSQGSSEAKITWSTEKKPPLSRTITITPDPQGYVAITATFEDVFTTPGRQTLTVTLESPMTPTDKKSLTLPIAVATPQTPVFLWTSQPEQEIGHSERMVGLWLRSQDRLTPSSLPAASVVALAAEAGELPKSLRQHLEERQGRLVLFAHACTSLEEKSPEKTFKNARLLCISQKELGLGFFLNPPASIPPDFFLWQKQRQNREERLAYAALFLQGF